jgi:hypothetical protein
MNAHLLTLCAFALFAGMRCAAAGSSEVALEGFKLEGDLAGGQAVFTLSATAHVENPRGGSLVLISGPVALTEARAHPRWRLKAEANGFVLTVDRAGKFPVEIQFNAAVQEIEGWRSVEFAVASSTLQPVALKGLPAETQFRFPGAARPERSGSEFKSYLPASGLVKLAWKEAQPDTEGKLFYAAEMWSQITVSPGLMRQTGLLEYKVMQGELSRALLRVRGGGEVTRVQCDHLLAWNLEPVPGSPDRHLVIQLNQPQKERFSVQVQMQTALGAFPQKCTAMELVPEGATRFAGYVRVLNDGAVRLEVSQAPGLSQISPEQFPENDATRGLGRAAGSQCFAYRFSSAENRLEIQADQILPELGVSQVLAYRLGENEQTIEAELELEIREAPLRELLLSVPRGYALARVNVSGLSDYFLLEPEGKPNAELRLVFGQPASGRLVLQLRLERNQPWAEPLWTLPGLEVLKAKSTRGHVAVAADAGFRLVAERTEGLTEITTAFFPRKLAGIQAAFRLSDSVWHATMRTERLPRTVQAECLHLFSVGEGIAYGSSLITYHISGSPVSTFRLELAEEHLNVEFTGKEIRNWQRSGNAYELQLHTPVSGSYSLLATYERPFQAQGETLAFTGARPLEAQTEQGYALVVSAHQFQVEPAAVSPGLTALEPGEIPAEYRLLFDAPVLAAYRYSARPFDLKLGLRPLLQGESLSLAADRAALHTRISKEGQALTTARYFIKKLGQPHVRMKLPAEAKLWSAAINDAPVVPVLDRDTYLVPLPTTADPNTVLRLDLKMATHSKDPVQVVLGTPALDAPVMLSEWTIEPDNGQRLGYRSGTLLPSNNASERSGFAQLARTLIGKTGGQAAGLCTGIFGLSAAAMLFWHWGATTARHRFSRRHLAGALLAVVATALAAAVLVQLGLILGQEHRTAPRELKFLASVQLPTDTAMVTVSNTPDRISWTALLNDTWPAVLGLAVWSYGWRERRNAARYSCFVAGWLALGWATLRLPNSAPLFVGLVGTLLMLHGVLPAAQRWFRLPPQPKPASTMSVGGSTAPATLGIVLAALLWSHSVSSAREAGHAVCPAGQFQGARPALLAMKNPGPRVPTGALLRPRSAANHTNSMADSVTQVIRVEDHFALGTARIRWQAQAGQVLPLLLEPAVLTGIRYPSNSLSLIQEVPWKPSGETNVVAARGLTARKTGQYEIEIHYQLQLASRDSQAGLHLPVPYGLANRLELQVSHGDVDVFSPQAVSIQRKLTQNDTVANLVLAPTDRAWIGWRPRSRDLRNEKTLFYAELWQLYVPAAGVVEGVHLVSLRPAKGELSELVLEIPAGATVTDVIAAPRSPAAAASNSVGEQSKLISLWRFDPDTRKLRITLHSPQSRPFALLVRSQIATGPLPFAQSLQPLRVADASGQVGLLGLGTGSDVQLDEVTTEALTPINLEDFPVDLAASLQAHIPGLTVRRAFRHSEVPGSVQLQASPVEPDVRVETQDTLSLGEDRVVLAANASVEILRAGIFRLSFALPPGMEVESISGPAVSHWTESPGEGGRTITLHFAGKTEGKQVLAITLAGPGVKATNEWTAPQLTWHEAGKQQGSLLLVPEQGLRLQVGGIEGMTQVDPQRSGIKQPGVLAFRAMQARRRLALKLEQVAPWVQVNSLQHFQVSDAQVKATANLQFQIENTGLKTLRVLVPTNAENVRIHGDQVADFRPVTGVVRGAHQPWEVKLHRRLMGPYSLQLACDFPVLSQSSEVWLRGIQAGDASLQRGFVMVQAGGRLEVRTGSLPASLQTAEWQSIPRELQAGASAQGANFTFRLLDPAFELPLALQRHEAAKVQSARVSQVTLTSVVSDAGMVLTQARLDLIPGDKQLLQLTLPTNAQFWVALVNDTGVSPWTEQGRLLIPLEQAVPRHQAVPVEIYYTVKAGANSGRRLNLELLAPRFDLPLENIVWRLSLNEQWKVQDWSGSLQLEQVELLPGLTVPELEVYLRDQEAKQRERSQQAEALLAAGNSALAEGDPHLARQAFQTAYGLSGHDRAFNEDARVQLHNLKLQQALIGLNVRQKGAAPESSALVRRLRERRDRKEIVYTQQDAKDIFDLNAAEENAALARLAERLIQQQDAATTQPNVLRTSLPQQGRRITFRRTVAVDPWADLRVGLQASTAPGGSWTNRVAILGVTLLTLGAFAWAGDRQSRTEPGAATGR